MTSEKEILSMRKEMDPCSTLTLNLNPVNEGIDWAPAAP